MTSRSRALALLAERLADPSFEPRHEAVPVSLVARDSVTRPPHRVAACRRVTTPG